MSRKYSKPTTKRQKYPKVHFKQYLYNANEPYEYTSTSALPVIEAELLDNSESMRQSFRYLAYRMRKRYV